MFLGCGSREAPRYAFASCSWVSVETPVDSCTAHLCVLACVCLKSKDPGPDTDCRRTCFCRQWKLEHSVFTLTLLFLDHPPHRNPVGTGHGWELPELEDLKFTSRAESSPFTLMPPRLESFRPARRAHGMFSSHEWLSTNGAG